MKKLLFTLALFIGLKSFGQVNAHEVAEVVVKTDKEVMTFIHKDKEDWEMQHLQNGEKDATKVQLKELDDVTDHSFTLELKEMGMKIKFDLTTKKAMMFQLDHGTNKYPETADNIADIASFK